MCCKKVTKPEILDLQVLVLFFFLSERRHIFQLILNKILYLCSKKPKYLNNCMLSQPAVVLRELSSRHLGLFCFNQKKEHLTLRKHVWFTQAFGICLLKEENRDIG